MSQAFQQDVLQTIVDATGAPAPLARSTWWFHLYNTTLADGNTPATTGRCAGTGYTPKKAAGSTGFWTGPTLASPSATENKTVITYTTNAGASWGTIKAVQIASSSGTGGVSYWWADVSPTQAVSSGNTVRWSTGSLDLTLT